MTVIWILLILFAVYFVFFVAPAIVSAAAIFSRRDWTDFETLLRPDYQFAPYTEQLREANHRLLQIASRTVETEAADKLLLRAEYYDLHAKKTVIFLHGYRSNPMVNFSVQGLSFAEHGYNLLIVHQRAHGESGGNSPTLGLLEQYDAIRWVDWVKQATDVSEIVIYGMSMGAATAAYAADKLDPACVKALILDCGYCSPFEQITLDCRRRHMPTFTMMPVIRLFVRLRCGVDLKQSVIPALSETRIPAFFLHGTEDKTVPFAKGRANFDACRSRKFFFTAEGIGHTMAFPAKREAAEQALFSFLDVKAVPDDPVEGLQPDNALLH